MSSPDTITLAGRIARLCQTQRALAAVTDQLGAALVARDWIAIEGLADRAAELAGDLGHDAYMVDKAERVLSTL